MRAADAALSVAAPSLQRRGRSLMNINITLHPQITIQGLRDAVRSLDVVAFFRAVTPALLYARDMPADEWLLVWALHEIDLPDEADNPAEWFEPYASLGVDMAWYDILFALRVRDQPESSLLVGDGFRDGADFLFSEADDEPAFVRSPRSEGPPHVSARTLGLSLQRGAWNMNTRLAIPAPPNDARLYELAEIVANRVRPTLGGNAYLAPDADGPPVPRPRRDVLQRARRGRPEHWQLLPFERRVVRSDWRRGLRCDGRHVNRASGRHRDSSPFWKGARHGRAEGRRQRPPFERRSIQSRSRNRRLMRSRWRVHLGLLSGRCLLRQGV
jgi:hypothetical protein